MKIYEFRDACICLTASVAIVTVCVCTFFLLSIWLEGWMNVDTQVGELRAEMKELNDKTEQFKSDLADLRKELMPSAFKGKPNGRNPR